MGLLNEELDGACAVCHRALDWVTDRNGNNGHWAHAAQDKNADHDPVRVSEKDITPIYRCDFCSADNPQFEIPVRDFAKVGGLPNTHSIGEWMICAECKPFVDNDQWSELINHVLERNTTLAEALRRGDYQEKDIRWFLTGTYAEVRVNMISKPVPIPKT